MKSVRQWEPKFPALHIKVGLGLIAVASTALTMHAQSFTASIVGQVTDKSGAVVAKADVQVKDEKTNEVRHVTSISDGRFNVPALLPGVYQLTVSAPGFQTVVENHIQLAGSQIAEFNEALPVGSEATAVNVNADAVTLDEESADRTVLLDSQQVEAFPTSFRNPLYVVNATAGVVSIRSGLNPYMSDQNQNRFALNGGRDESSALLVDGASTIAMGFGGTMATPVMDSVESVQVQRTAYDPLYTHTDGGAVAQITKRGTNAFHGSVFEFITNDHLGANSWDNKHNGIKRPLFQRNQFGASMGGPIMHDRLFFFGAYEALRQAQPQSWSGIVPTALERTGDFSQTKNPDGTTHLIYDPFTQTGTGSTFARQPYAGNKILTSELSKFGLAAAALYPLPNIANAGVGQANWAGTTKVISNYDKFSVRGDYVFGPKDTLFASYLQGWQIDDAIRFFHNVGDSMTGENDYRKLAIISNTWVPNAKWVINTLADYAFWTEDDITPSENGPAASFGMSSASTSLFQDPTIFPSLSFENYLPLGASQHSISPHANVDIQVNVSKVTGNHTTRFGFLGEQMRFFVNKASSANFGFNSGPTSGPVAQTDGSITTTGSSIASMLIGVGASGDAPYIPKLALQMYQSGWYIADSWKASRRLTINTGLRYEIQMPRTERFNRQNYFSTTVTSPFQGAGLGNVQGGLIFSGVNGASRGLFQQQYTNFAPRFSLAYELNSRMVLRGGWGLFYPLTYSNSKDTSNSSDGFSADTSWVPTVNNAGLVPQDSLNNPFPNGLVQPLGASLGLKTQAGQKVNAIYYNHPRSYVQNFSLDVQTRVMRDTVVEIGYAGSLGRQLAVGVFQNLDQLPSQYLALGTTALNNKVTNPLYGQIASGSIASATIPYWRTLDKYPQFSSVNLLSSDMGSSSNYHAFTAKYNEHIGSHTNILLTYQWSKALDDTSETNGWEISDQIRDTFNHKIEYGYSAHDIPQSFVASVVLGLPFGRGRAILSNANRYVNAIIGGWELSNIYRYSSGLPLTFQTNNNLSTYNYNITRPDIASYSRLKVANKTIDKWFNTDLTNVTHPYTTGPLGTVYHIGNINRWVGAVRRAPTNEDDMDLSKSFPLPWREMSLQFRAEAYNLTNTPQYAGPDTNIDDGTNYGKVTATTNIQPRVVQFAARISF